MGDRTFISSKVDEVLKEVEAYQLNQTLPKYQVLSEASKDDFYNSPA